LRPFLPEKCPRRTIFFSDQIQTHLKAVFLPFQGKEKTSGDRFFAE